MKKQNQVRRNGSPAAAIPQSKTNARKKSAPACRQVAGTVTCVWTGPDGREWARVDFDPELFSRIEHAAAKLGITLQQFFDNAIRCYCDSRDERRAA